MQRAEALADLVGRLARNEAMLPHEVKASGFSPERVEAAAVAVRDAARRWAALPVGERLVVEWNSRPSKRAMRRPT